MADSKLSKVNFRLAIGAANGPRSNVWRGFSNRDEAYLCHGGLGRIEKISFHSSGVCRQAFTEVEGPAEGETDRVIEKWKRSSTPDCGGGAGQAVLAAARARRAGHSSHQMPTRPPRQRRLHQTPLAYASDGSDVYQTSPSMGRMRVGCYSTTYREMDMWARMVCRAFRCRGCVAAAKHESYFCFGGCSQHSHTTPVASPFDAVQQPYDHRLSALTSCCVPSV
jgi:hypothetical protein